MALESCHSVGIRYTVVSSLHSKGGLSLWPKKVTRYRRRAARTCEPRCITRAPSCWTATRCSVRRSWPTVDEASARPSRSAPCSGGRAAPRTRSTGRCSRAAAAARRTPSEDGAGRARVAAGPRVAARHAARRQLRVRRRGAHRRLRLLRPHRLRGRAGAGARPPGSAAWGACDPRAARQPRSRDRRAGASDRSPAAALPANPPGSRDRTDGVGLGRPGGRIPGAWPRGDPGAGRAAARRRRSARQPGCPAPAGPGRRRRPAASPGSPQRKQSPAGAAGGAAGGNGGVGTGGHRRVRQRRPRRIGHRSGSGSGTGERLRHGQRRRDRVPAAAGTGSGRRWRRPPAGAAAGRGDRAVSPGAPSTDPATPFATRPKTVPTTPSDDGTERGQVPSATPPPARPAAGGSAAKRLRGCRRLRGRGHAPGPPMRARPSRPPRRQPTWPPER